MKKLVLSTFIMFFGFSTWAQSFSAGLEGGVNTRRFWGNQMVNQSILGAAWANSLWFRYDFNESVGMQIGIGTERKGTVQASSTTSLPNINALHTNLNYAVIPLLANAYFTRERRLYLQAGAYLGFLTAANQVLVGNTPSEPVEMRTNFKNLDAGSCIGLGYRIVDAGNFSLFSQLRANIGFLNISNLPVLGDGTIRNFTLDARVGMSYRFGE
ncbi:MAG: outer membrane beta-barrel protein [Bacteroidia bacterium]